MIFFAFFLLQLLISNLRGECVSMSNNNAIEFKHVKFTYPDSKKTVLKDVNFVVKKGSWVSLIGHNGSGKSTISKLINGLLLPDENSDIWDIREKVGIVFQNPDNQFVGATVGDDVAFGLENRGVPRQEMIKIVRNVLSEVGMLEYIDSEPANLSGGQKQRIAIAGILAVEPQIIILDESTSMLDPSGRKQILKIISELMKKKQLTVVSITHDIDEANMADSVIVLNDGEIIDQDSPVKIFNKTTMLKQIGLDIPFTNKLILALDKSGVSVPQNVRTKDELKQYLCQLNLKI